MMLYLVRESAQGVCHCNCDEASAVPMVPGTTQADCPWCGCGYLFSCLTCGLAFTFGRCAEVADAPEEIARRQWKAMFETTREPSASQIDSLLRPLTSVQADLVLGHRYVVLDGRLLRLDVPGCHFVGQYGRHAWEQVPHLLNAPQPKEPIRPAELSVLAPALDIHYWMWAHARKRRTVS